MMRNWHEYYAIEVSEDGENWLDSGRKDHRSSRHAILEATEVLEATNHRMTRVVVRLQAEHFRAIRDPDREKREAAEAASS